MHDKIRRRLLAALTGTLMGITGGMVAASPAFATWSDCAAYSDVVCFHQYPDFTGQVWRQRTGQFPTGCRNFAPEGFDNKASTAFNRTDDYQLRVYQNANCTGSYVYVAPGGVKVFSSTEPDYWFNNTASSAKITYVG